MSVIYNVCKRNNAGSGSKLLEVFSFGNVNDAIAMHKEKKGFRGIYSQWTIEIGYDDTQESFVYAP